MKEVKKEMPQLKFLYILYLLIKYYVSRQLCVQVKVDIDSFNDIIYTCTFMINNMLNLIVPILLNNRDNEQIELKKNTLNNKYNLITEKNLFLCLRNRFISKNNTHLLTN